MTCLVWRLGSNAEGRFEAAHLKSALPPRHGAILVVQSWRELWTANIGQVYMGTTFYAG